jgi:hypothetical protein
MSIEDNIKEGAPDPGNFQDFKVDPTLQDTAPNFQTQGGPQATAVPPPIYQQNNPYGQPNFQGYAKAPEIISNFLQLAPTISLSTDGEQYLNQVIRIITDSQFLVKNLKVDILSSPQKSVLVSLGNQYGYLILFEETLKTALDNQIIDYKINPNDPNRNIPISRIATATAVNNIIKLGYNVPESKFILLGSDIIRPKDYQNNGATKLADRIKSIFRLQEMSSNFLSSSIVYPDILRGSTLSIVMDYNEIRANMDLFNPHCIMPRVDYGCKLLLNYPTNQTGYSQNVRSSFAIGSIGGYTQFIADTTYGGYNVGPKYTPIVHITDISTPLPTPGLLPLLISTFFNIFISRKQWKQPYYNLTEDNGHHDIAALFPLDAEGNAPVRGLDSVEGRQSILNSDHFNPAIMVLDITEGNYLLSSMQNQNFINLNNLIKHQTIHSLKVDYINHDIFVDAPWEEYTGMIKQGEQLADSRFFSDFLTAFNVKRDYNLTAPLLNIQIDPQERVRIMKMLYGEDFIVQAVTNVYRINIEWLLEIQGYLKQLIVIDSRNIGLDTGNQIIDFSSDINSYIQNQPNISAIYAPYAQTRQYDQTAPYVYGPTIPNFRNPKSII